MLSRSFRSLWAGLLAGVAVVAVWQVISRSIVAHLAVVAPETALRIRSSDATALLNVADRSLNAEPSSAGEQPSDVTGRDQVRQDAAEALQKAGERLRVWSEMGKKTTSRKAGQAPVSAAIEPGAAAQNHDQIRALAELALMHDPLNARALRILGQLADAAGDRQSAGKFMRAAASRSLRESLAFYWLMEKSFAEKDYATAISGADVLLRTRPQLMPHVLPTLAKIAETKVATGDLTRLLAGNPPWRAAFFWSLPNAVTDARTPLELLLALRDAPTPPTAADLREYLNVLIRHKFYELAYYTWLQFLPPDQLSSTGLLFNGSFEVTPSGLPFDWGITAGAGVTIDLAERPDQQGQRALFIEFGLGRAEFPAISQLIMLAPGTYKLKGQYKADIVARRGLIWRVTCAGGNGTPIGESLMIIGVTPVWRGIEFSFTVPDADCRAQYVRLELAARMASEQLVSGSVWHDELQISRTN